jgi:hypothetical protein
MCVQPDPKWRFLLDAHPTDRPRDHQLLNLLGAIEDVVGLIWTYPLVTVVAVCER